MKAFIIRKKDDMLSENYADQCIESAKTFNIKIEKFDGVYSNHDRLFEKHKLFPFHKMGEGRITNRGVQGCFLSHYLLWLKCIELGEPILILEYDALFIRPLPENILDLFSHHCIVDDSVHEENYEDILKNNETQVINHPKIDGKIVFSRLDHVRGSHAHIVKPLGAETIVNSVKTHGWMPADRCVNTNYTNYITIRPIPIRCHPFFSVVENRMMHSHVISNKIRTVN